MIKVTIDFWQLQKMFQENEPLYDLLLSIDDSKFIRKPTNTKKITEDGKKSLEGYSACEFFVNEFESIDQNLWEFCKFEPIPKLEMMESGNINSKNVFQAAQRNQIMLPNNLLFEMKELLLEENACTNSINEHLQNGYKIIAVLPQHQQRRPDYILGKL